MDDIYKEIWFEKQAYSNIEEACWTSKDISLEILEKVCLTQGIVYLNAPAVMYLLKEIGEGPVSDTTDAIKTSLSNEGVLLFGAKIKVILDAAGEDEGWMSFPMNSTIM